MTTPELLLPTTARHRSHRSQPVVNRPLSRLSEPPAGAAGDREGTVAATAPPLLQAMLLQPLQKARSRAL